MQLFEERRVLLKELAVIYDIDHNIDTISLKCEPNIVTGTGRLATDEQLQSIFLTLFGKENIPKLSNLSKNKNLLPKPVECYLIFSDNILIGFRRLTSLYYCHLGLNQIYDYYNFEKQVKTEKKEQVMKNIKKYIRKISELLDIYLELSK